MTSARHKAALKAYWDAKTPQQERTAYQRMRALGLKPAYGERESFLESIARHIRWWCYGRG